MSRETLKDFFIKNAIPEDSISFSHDSEPTPDGLGNLNSLHLGGNEDIKIDPNSGQTLLDLDSADPAGILGDYLSFLSKEADHVYPISPGNEASAPTNRGEYLAISSEHGAEKIYITPGTELASNFNVYSNGQFVNIKDVVDKIGLDNDENSGHKLLNSIEGTGTNDYGEVTHQEGEDNKVVQAVHNEVLIKSRFGNIPNKEIFVSKNESQDTHDQKEKLKINNKFGSHSHLDEETLVRLEQLKNLGASLLMKVSGFDNGDTPGESLNPEELEASMVTGELRSSLIKGRPNEIGAPGIQAEAYRAKNATGFPQKEASDESIRAGRGEAIGHVDTRSSYGATYNSGMHFSGKNHKLHKYQAALSLYALDEVSRRIYSSIIRHLTSIADLNGDVYSKIEDNFNEFLHEPLLGHARKLVNLKLDYIKNSVLVPTRYPYKSSFDRGLKVLFGIEYVDNTAKREKPTVESIKISKQVTSSPGFWLAVSRSAIKSANQTFDSLDLLSQTDIDSESINNFISAMASNNIIRYMNAIATVGDASFQAYGGGDISNDAFFKRSRNVDSLPDSPGTRVGKSRKDNGYRQNQLAWSQNDVPSAYLLPLNPIRAAGRLDKIVSGPNPFTAMVGSELVDQTYFSKNMDGSSNRIPKEVVETLENKLDAEYVPFYFQDLRTNEIISFHAFLDSLTDTINPNYSTFPGYGRLDPVRIYESTTRSISIGFTVVATSKQDFNTMWYKINKFVTLLYPQWTKGTMVGQSLEGGVTSKFLQPNTQVLGASPLVRMRVGDIIKSNYSKFNLARMFGIGDGDVQPLPADSSPAAIITNAFDYEAQNVINKIKDYSVSLLALVYGSPIQFFNLQGTKDQAAKLGSFGQKALSGLSSTATNFLKNGFVNPLTLGFVLNRIKDPNVEINSAIAGNKFDKTTPAQNAGQSIAESIGDQLSGPHKNYTVYLNSNYNQGYKIIGGNDVMVGKRLMIQKPIKVKIVKKNLSSYEGIKFSKDLEKTSKTKVTYEVEIVDFSIPADAQSLVLYCMPSDIYQMPNKTLIDTLEFGLLLAGAGGVISPLADSGLNSNLIKGFANSTGTAPAIDLIRSLYQSQESSFMDSFNNPFAKAYESTSGRGLAGTIGSVSFNWLDNFPWEIDHNSRAPIGCKISFSFDVIHDIAPGLDHSGYNRAPLYNVGDIMKNVSGDSYESFFKEDEFEFRKQANKGIKITGKK